MSRITEVDSTEELMLIRAPSRNRAVYRLRGPFLGTFFVTIPIHREASKKVQNLIFTIILFKIGISNNTLMYY